MRQYVVQRTFPEGVEVPVANGGVAICDVVVELNQVGPSNLRRRDQPAASGTVAAGYVVSTTRSRGLGTPRAMPQHDASRTLGRRPREATSLACTPMPRPVTSRTLVINH
jgi:hypothetical protein